MATWEEYKREVLEILQETDYDDSLIDFLTAKGLTIQEGADLLRECKEALQKRKTGRSGGE